MNDILAPIFSVYIAEKFGMNYLKLENNIGQVKDQITEKVLLEAEADSFFALSYFLSGLK